MSFPFAPVRLRPAPLPPLAANAAGSDVDQGIQAAHAFEHHVAAAAAIAAIGPTIFDELLASERHAAVAAVAGAHINLGFIEEFHRATP
jgi:hypothetical protein